MPRDRGSTGQDRAYLIRKPYELSHRHREEAGCRSWKPFGKLAVYPVRNEPAPLSHAPGHIKSDTATEKGIGADSELDNPGSKEQLTVSTSSDTAPSRVLSLKHLDQVSSSPVVLNLVQHPF
jgi:hypothetical protein